MSLTPVPPTSAPMPPPSDEPPGSRLPPAPATWRMTLQPQGWDIDVPPRMALLAAARAAGVLMPSSCRNGTCRACMCRVVQGRVSYLIEWPGLSAQEKQEGFVLPCVAVAESTLVIEAPGARKASTG